MKRVKSGSTFLLSTESYGVQQRVHYFGDSSPFSSASETCEFLARVWVEKGMSDMGMVSPLS